MELFAVYSRSDPTSVKVRKRRSNGFETATGLTRVSELEVICSRPYDPNDTFADILSDANASLRDPPATGPPGGTPETTPVPPTTPAATEIRFGAAGSKCLTVSEAEFTNGKPVTL